MGSIFRSNFTQNLIQTKEKDHSSGASQSREKKVSIVFRNNSVFVFREKTSLFPDRPQKNQSQNRSLNQLKNQNQSRNLSQKQNQKSLKRVPRKSKSHFDKKITRKLIGCFTGQRQRRRWWRRWLPLWRTARRTWAASMATWTPPGRSPLWWICHDLTSNNVTARPPLMSKQVSVAIYFKKDSS